jgi:peptidoglycan hydrolase-like protein with peptidoglycan-binding domain
MTKKHTWLCVCGAVLLASAALVVSPAASMPAAAQSSSKAQKKKPTRSRTRPRVTRRRVRRARGQAVPTKERITEIQSALQREGALNKEPTGKWDATSIDAMKKFQQDHGLNPTGKIDALSLEKLGLGSETAGKGAPVPTAASTPPDQAPPSTQ